jgi:DNA-3-methyladenine glycosylase
MPAVSSRVRRLRRSELPSGTIDLARCLIGKVVVRETRWGRMSGRIVETEAYPVGDAAGHAFRGQTGRNRSLFLGHGRAYIYIAYGTSFMLNVSSETPGVGAGVLVRALEPGDGIDMMQRRRRTTRLVDLARGPGRLTQAMAIDLGHDGLDLCAAGPVWLGTTPEQGCVVGESVRIGITRNADAVLRFFERGSPFVSGPRRLMNGSS